MIGGIQHRSIKPNWSVLIASQASITLLATALVAVSAVADPKTFRSGRNFSAWIRGCSPKQHSSGGRDRLGSISKQGDRYLPQPVRGQYHSPSFASRQDPRHQVSAWVAALLARRPTKKSSPSALANKLARPAWATMVQGRAMKVSASSAEGLARLVPSTHGRDVMPGRANSTRCRAGRSGDQDNPPWGHCIPQVRVGDRDLIRGEHYGQQSCEPPLKGRTHMAAPTRPTT